MPRLTDKPRYAKAHSQAVADEYMRLGWTLRKQFRSAEAKEPYEYLLEWLRAGEPDYPKSRRDKP